MNRNTRNNLRGRLLATALALLFIFEQSSTLVLAAAEPFLEAPTTVQQEVQSSTGEELPEEPSAEPTVGGEDEAPTPTVTEDGTKKAEPKPTVDEQPNSLSMQVGPQAETETVDVTGTFVFLSDEATEPDEIKEKLGLTIYANGAAIDSCDLCIEAVEDTANPYRYTFENLRKTDAEGTDIVYTIQALGLIGETPSDLRLYDVDTQNQSFNILPNDAPWNPLDHEGFVCVALKSISGDYVVKKKPAEPAPGDIRLSVGTKDQGDALLIGEDEDSFTLADTKTSWQTAKLSTHNPLTKEAVEYQVKVLSNADDYKASYPDENRDYALDGETITNTFDDHEKYPAYVVKSSTDVAAHINWNDNTQDGKRPGRDEESVRPVLKYRISENDEWKSLSWEDLWKWGIHSEIDNSEQREAKLKSILAPTADDNETNNYWHYNYGELPKMITYTKCRDEETGELIIENWDIEYSFDWSASQAAVAEHYFSAEKESEANTIVNTIKTSAEFKKDWKDGENALGTRPGSENDEEINSENDEDIKAFLENIEYTLYYVSLGQEKITSSGTLYKFYGDNPENANGPQVSVDTKANPWVISVTNMHGYTLEGDPYYLRIKETNNTSPVNEGSEIEGDVSYKATYENTGNNAEDHNYCYSGGTIINTLEGTATINATKQWQDEDSNERPAGTLTLYRYPNVEGRSYANASAVEGARVTFDEKSTGNQFQIKFSEDNTYPRFDSAGNELIYLVKESLTGDNARKYTRFYNYGEGEKAPGEGDVLYNGGTMQNRRTGEISKTVTKRWNAAAQQDKSSSVTFLVERKVASDGDGTYEPVNSVGKDGKFELSGFRSEIIEKDHTFANLPEFNEEGKRYEYRIREVAVTVGGKTVKLDEKSTDNNKWYKDGDQLFCVLDGYTYKLEQSADGESDNIKFTNTLVGETQIEIEKYWNGLIDDHKESGTPTATFSIYQNGALVGTSGQYKIEGNDAAYRPEKGEGDYIGTPTPLTITGLPRYDGQGQEYKYTFSETGVAGYHVSYSTVRDERTVDGKKQGYVKSKVTNTPAEEGKHITVTKEWDDFGDENCRGPVIVDLYHKNSEGNWEKVEGRSGKLSVANDWKVWLSLDALKENGEKDLDPNNYYVKERSIERSKEYPVKYTTVDGEGVVDDYPSLNADFTKVGEAITDRHHYISYAKINANGDHYSFKNVRTGVVEFDLSKIWNDNGHHLKEGQKQQVVLGIYRKLANQSNDWVNYSLVQDVVLNGDESPDNWKAQVKDLPKYDEKGVPYNYLVREKEIIVEGHADRISVSYDSENGNRYVLPDGHQYAVSVNTEVAYGDQSQNEEYPVPDCYTVQVTNSRYAVQNISFNKVWKDVKRENPGENSSEYRSRPLIYFDLFQRIEGNEEITALEKSYEVFWDADDGYVAKAEYRQLPRYTNDGKEIYYFAQERANGGMGEYVTEYYTGQPEVVVKSDKNAYLANITKKDVYTVEGEPLWSSDTKAQEGYLPAGGTVVNVREGQRYLTGRKIWQNLPSGLKAEYFPNVSFRLKIYLDDDQGSYDYLTEGEAQFVGNLEGDKITFKFKVDGKEADSLRKFDDFGVIQRYRAEEFYDLGAGDGEQANHPNGYARPVYDEYNMTVTNSYETNPPEEDRVSVKVTKDWEIPDWYQGDKPTATLRLMRVMTDATGADIVDSAVAVPQDETDPSSTKLTWLHTAGNSNNSKTFENLPRYGYNGNPYRYYFVEDEINGYTVRGL